MKNIGIKKYMAFALLLVPGSMFGMLRRTVHLRTLLKRIAPNINMRRLRRAVPIVHKRSFHDLDSNKVLEDAFAKIQEKNRRERLGIITENVQKSFTARKRAEEKQLFKETLSNNPVVQRWRKKIIDNDSAVSQWIKKINEGAQHIENKVKNNPINQGINTWKDECNQAKKDEIIADAMYKNQRLPDLNRELNYLRSPRFVIYRYAELVLFFPFCFIPPMCFFAIPCTLYSSWQLSSRKVKIQRLEQQFNEYTHEVKSVIIQLDKEKRES